MIDPIQQKVIEARRNQILDAATTVFATQGFHPTTIKDIAKYAGIADGTIYNYFQNKSALLIGIFERMKASILGQAPLPEINQLTLPIFIKTFLTHPLKTLEDDHFALFRVIVSEMMVNNELRDLYYQHILEPTLQIAEGYLQGWSDQHQTPLMNISLTVRAISGMVMGIIIENILGDKPLNAQWESLPDFLTNLLINGLGEK